MREIINSYRVIIRLIDRAKLFRWRYKRLDTTGTCRTSLPRTVWKVRWLYRRPGSNTLLVTYIEQSPPLQIGTYFGGSFNGDVETSTDFSPFTSITVTKLLGSVVWIGKWSFKFASIVDDCIRLSLKRAESSLTHWFTELLSHAMLCSAVCCCKKVCCYKRATQINNCFKIHRIFQ